MMRFDHAINPQTKGTTNLATYSTTEVIFRIASKAREILPNDPGHDQAEVFLDHLAQIYNALDPDDPALPNDYDADIDI